MRIQRLMRTAFGWNIAFVLPLLVMLGSGCGISPYRREVTFMFNGFGGYSETKIRELDYQVTYRSPHAAFNNQAKVRDFALRRACELAISEGYGFFVILGEGGDGYKWNIGIRLKQSKVAGSFDAKATLLKLEPLADVGLTHNGR